MNARENVVAELAYVVGKAQAASMMRAALREHAHELAKEIRAHELPDLMSLREHGPGLRMAANLIDPRSGAKP